MPKLNQFERCCRKDAPEMYAADGAASAQGAVMRRVDPKAGLVVPSHTKADSGCERAAATVVRRRWEGLADRYMRPFMRVTSASILFCSFSIFWPGADSFKAAGRGRCGKELTSTSSIRRRRIKRSSFSNGYSTSIPA
jgi:hypothetical protein